MTLRVLAAASALLATLILSTASHAAPAEANTRATIAGAKHVVIMRVTGSDKACTGSVNAAFVGDVVDRVRGSASGRVDARVRLPPGVKPGDVLVASVELTEPYALVVSNECGGARARIVKASGRVTAWVRADDVNSARQLARQVLGAS